MLCEVDLLPALVVQEEPVPVGGDIPGRAGDGDVGRVHVCHDAAVGHRPQQPAERRKRDPGGEEQHSPNPAAAPESAAAAAHGGRKARALLQDRARSEGKQTVEPSDRGRDLAPWGQLGGIQGRREGSLAGAEVPSGECRGQGRVPRRTLGGGRVAEM